jgi:dipeptidase E
MKFFLASRIGNPLTIPKLEKFIRSKLSEKTVAFIPTASNAEIGYGNWKASETMKMIQETAKSTKIILLEDCWERDVMRDIAGVDIIWVAGGLTGDLLYWMRRSQFDKTLPDLLNKGAVYVGSSAGAMVCSKTQYASEFLGDLESGASLIPGLGYLDFEISPHYTDEKYEEIKKIWKQKGKCDLYLLKDGEAITLEDGKTEILGETRIITA